MFAVAPTDVDFYSNNGLNYSSMVSTSARNEEKSSRRLVIIVFLINIPKSNLDFNSFVESAARSPRVHCNNSNPFLNHYRVHLDAPAYNAPTAEPPKRRCGVEIRAVNLFAMHVAYTSSCTTLIGQ